MAYKSARKKPDAAKGPKERNMPFTMEDAFRVASGAKNDPVGMAEPYVSPYEMDRRLNWVERN